MREIRYLKAVSEAIETEMESDPSIFYMGEDVRYALKGVARGWYPIIGEGIPSENNKSSSGIKYYSCSIMYWRMIIIYYRIA